MSQSNIQNDIHEFCDEWGHYVDTENLKFTINNDEPRQSKYKYKYKYKVLEKISDEYDYYINNQTKIELIDNIQMKDNIPTNNNIPTSLIKYKKLDIPNIASTICCTIFLTTLVMFIL
jgi:hypothetical protein